MVEEYVLDMKREKLTTMLLARLVITHSTLDKTQSKVANV
jgi:hypothetical protein